MSDRVDEFIARVDRLEAVHRKNKYIKFWLIPRDLLVEIRDELKSLTGKQNPAPQSGMRNRREGKGGEEER